MGKQMVAISHSGSERLELPHNVNSKGSTETFSLVLTFDHQYRYCIQTPD